MRGRFTGSLRIYSEEDFTKSRAVASAGRGGASLDELTQKLFNFVKETQIQAHTNPRYIGSWHVSVSFRGIAACVQTDSFFPTFTAIILNGLANELAPQYIAPLTLQVEKLLELYLGDAARTAEPAGTIAYWPLEKFPSGKEARTVRNCAPYFSVSLPNDLDSSAAAATFFLNRGIKSSFVTDFMRTIGLFRDLRREPHKNRTVTGQNFVNTGAFLTWAEPEFTQGSRIIWGSNDVDCVVNLNILGAVGLHRENGGLVPEETQFGVEAACRFVEDVLTHGKTSQCSIYYDRTSQFLIAWARANQVGTSCLSKMLPAVRILALDEAKRVLKNSRKNPTEIAEILTALKKVHPIKSDRSLSVNKTINALTEALMSQITLEGSFAFINSKDSVTRDALKFPYHSRAYSSVLALQALLLK